MKKEDGRVRITRQLIRDALLQLLQEKPLQHITVRELCEKASVNRGTFYAHYKDIYDLMEQIEQHMFDEFKSILRPLIEDQDPYDLVETVTRIFSYIQEHADLCLVTLGPTGQTSVPELTAHFVPACGSAHAGLLLHLCLFWLHRHIGKMDEGRHARRFRTSCRICPHAHLPGI